MPNPVYIYVCVSMCVRMCIYIYIYMSVLSLVWLFFVLYISTVLFQTIQLSISTQFSSI